MLELTSYLCWVLHTILNNVSISIQCNSTIQVIFVSSEIINIFTPAQLLTFILNKHLHSSTMKVQKESQTI